MITFATIYKTDNSEDRLIQVFIDGKPADSDQFGSILTALNDQPISELIADQANIETKKPKPRKERNEL